jgi:hypothetical protein
VEFVGFEEPVFAVAPAMEIEPIFRAESQQNFLCDVARKRQAEVDGMLEALLKNGHGALKIARGKVLLEGCGADDFVVEFDGCSGRAGGDFEIFCGGEGGAGKRQQGGEADAG